MIYDVCRREKKLVKSLIKYSRKLISIEGYQDSNMLQKRIGMNYEQSLIKIIIKK